MSGLELCQRVRTKPTGSVAVVLVITSRHSKEDLEALLAAGADDYLVKPFVLKELLARVRALLRRNRFHEEADDVELKSGALALHTGSMKVVVADQPVSLSATEFALLEHLMRHQGKVLTREELLEHVWQFDFGGDSNVLHVYISYLRKKLADRGLPNIIHTVRGVGYRLQETR